MIFGETLLNFKLTMFVFYMFAEGRFVILFLSYD